MPSFLLACIYVLYFVCLVTSFNISVYMPSDDTKLYMVGRANLAKFSTYDLSPERDETSTHVKYAVQPAADVRMDSDGQTYLTSTCMRTAAPKYIIT